MEVKEKEIFKKFINYEMALGKFFRELDLKPNLCQLIRAFLLVSKGEKTFEASFAELADVFQKKEKESKRADNNARNALKTLLKWQEKSEIELIRVSRNGKRIKLESGSYTYIKSKYEFVALNELVKILYSDSEKLESVITEELAKIKEKFTPVEKAKTYHSLHRFRKAKNTIFTKIKRVFELAKDSGLKPNDECQRVVNKCSDIIKQLTSESEENEKRKNYIAEFENIFESREVKGNLEIITG